MSEIQETPSVKVVRIKRRTPRVEPTLPENANLDIDQTIAKYLNEKCGQAINLDDFIVSIVIDNDDCETLINKRYLFGTQELLCKKLLLLPTTNRPINCFRGQDKRQEILHVRNNNLWFEELEKDWLYQIAAIEDDDEIEDGKLLNLYRCLKLYDTKLLFQLQSYLQKKKIIKRRKVNTMQFYLK